MIATLDNNNDGVATPANWHLVAVGVLTLVWSSYGIARYLSTQFGLLDAAAISGLELAQFVSLPLWAKAAWAVSAWGAFAGAALLLVRSKWAVQAFVMALIGLAATTFYQTAFSAQVVSIYDMPITLATWFVTIAAAFFTLRVYSLNLLR